MPRKGTFSSAGAFLLTSPHRNVLEALSLLDASISDLRLIAKITHRGMKIYISFTEELVHVGPQRAVDGM
jgi:hypothetical protein